MIRLFKPGDRVQLKTGGPVMEVIKYATEESPILGKYESNLKVVCVWYDQDEGRQLATFHQNSLTKVHWVVGKQFSTVFGPKESPVSGSYDTLAEAIQYLKAQGFKKEFRIVDGKLQDPETENIFLPEEVNLVNIFRFEGDRDVTGLSVVYAVQCNDGTKGLITDEYGKYGISNLAEVLIKMRDHHLI